MMTCLVVVCSYSIGTYACEGVGVKCVGRLLRERDGVGVECEYVCGIRGVSLSLYFFLISRMDSRLYTAIYVLCFPSI